MKRNGIILIIYLIIICLTGCLAESNKKKNDIESIVVTSPEVAEVIYELGSLDRIVGRASYCDTPNQMDKIEIVGDFSTIDIEKVLDISPDIVFTANMEQESQSEKLANYGIKVEVINSTSIESFYNNVNKIAAIIGKEDKGNEIISNFQKELDSLTLPENSPKVYFEISPNLGTIGKPSFISDAITKAGGMNIFKSINKSFLIAKNEDILNFNPDIIIALSGLSKDEISKRKGWNNLSAIRNEQIYTAEDLNPNHLFRCVPNSIEAIKIMNQIFLNYDK